jgi:hypothetical protein
MFCKSCNALLLIIFVIPLHEYCENHKISDFRGPESPCGTGGKKMQLVSKQTSSAIFSYSKKKSVCIEVFHGIWGPWTSYVCILRHRETLSYDTVVFFWSTQFSQRNATNNAVLTLQPSASFGIHCLPWNQCHQHCKVGLIWATGIQATI